MTAYERVLEQLNVHFPTDAKEKQDCDFIRLCLAASECCFGEENPKAHLTGSAFVLDEQGRGLFTHHRKLNRWLQLGGHSEVAERCLSETAYREAVEESGLSDLIFHPGVSPKLLDVDVHQIPARANRQAHYHLDFRYVFLTCMPQEIVVSSESHRLAWFHIADALRLEIDPALSRALCKLPSVEKAVMGGKDD